MTTQYTREQLLEMMNPVLEKAAEMAKAGVLKKNIIRRFVALNFPYAAAENIADVGIARAQEFAKNTI
jgi:hypothetical protein